MIGKCLRGIGSVGPARDFLTDPRLRILNALINGSAYLVIAITVQQHLSPLSGQLAGAYHRFQIAFQPVLQPIVGEKKLEHIPSFLPTLIQLQRGNTQSVLPYIPGPWIIPAGNRASVIPHMTANRGKQHRTAPMKNRHNDRPVQTVGAAIIRIIHE
ncbi:hypothetical protein D3C73_1116010 [compost metagenome]